MIDLPLIYESLPALLNGVMVSLQITAFAAILGILLGSIFGCAEALNVPLISWPIKCYVFLFRGTPMLVQILFVYYVLPELGVNLPPFWAAGLAIGLNSAAYISQIILTGINAVPRGQIEAAQTLGFSPWRTWYYIVFPQAFRVVVPALGNEFITLIKDSSLASIIGVMELTKEASIIRSRTYDAFSILLAVSLIYLILTATLSLCLKYYETKVKQYA